MQWWQSSEQNYNYLVNLKNGDMEQKAIREVWSDPSFPGQYTTLVGGRSKSKEKETHHFIFFSNSQKCFNLEQITHVFLGHEYLSIIITPQNKIVKDSY